MIWRWGAVLLMMLAMAAGCKEKRAEAKPAEAATETISETKMEKLKEYGFAAIPESTPNFPKWNFDLQIEEKKAEINSQLAEDKEGYMRLITDEYKKNPIDENLVPSNPTIRWVEAQYEEFALECLKQAGYREVDATPLYPALDRQKEENNSLRAWHLEGDSYFYIFADFSGAWRLRRYGFAKRVGKTFQNVVCFDTMPTRDQALTARGAIHGDAAGCNNLAVMMLNREAAMFSYDDNAVLKLLKQAIQGGCKAAERNLYLYYLKEEQFDLARQLAPRVANVPPIPNRPPKLSGDERQHYLKEGQRLLAAKEYAKAKTFLQRLADSEDEEGTYWLGELYYATGDKKAAAAAFQKSQYGEAMYRLAIMSIYGDGIPVNGRTAEETLLEMSKMIPGEKIALPLGRLYYFGMAGIPQNRVTGCRYLLKACTINENNPPDQAPGDAVDHAIALKDFYYRDAETAGEFYAKLLPEAEAGNRFAMEILIELYLTGAGLPAPAPLQARKWAKKLAVTAPTPVNHWRCFLVFSSIDTPAAQRQAERWLRLAADRKYPEALPALAKLLLERGDIAGARKYLEDPANTAPHGVQMRDELRRKEQK